MKLPKFVTRRHHLSVSVTAEQRRRHSRLAVLGDTRIRFQGAHDLHL
jgi:hypothetical protein